MQPPLLLMALLLSPVVETGRIIGGREARPHSRPYMALLGDNHLKEEYCGGFLVREDVVLTAAHCYRRSISITLGAHNIRQHEETQQHIPVRRAIPHPRYEPKPRWFNDIMVLQLKKKVKLTATVRPISLPWRGSQAKPGMVCSVAGWGLLGVNAGVADKLQEVDLEIQRDRECTSHRYQYYNNTIQICAGSPNKNKASFKGDSGGPLVCYNTVQGIVSYGKTNGKPPQVYTRISSYLHWIQRTIRHLKLHRPD